MNTYTKIFTLLFLFLGTSCEKWLDVKPGEQATESELLKTADGYRSLLLGIYQTMATPALYGRELSFGFVDCISQQYKIDNVDLRTFNKSYYDAGKFSYTTSNLATLIKKTWQTGFNVIANANSLIQVVASSDPEIYTGKSMEKNLILGEALACRALIHFDLLRLFATPVVNDDGNAYVPYAETYPNIYAQAIPVKPFLDKVIHDLERARELVAEWDTTSFAKGAFISGKARFRNEFSFGTEIYSSNEWEDFFKGRGYRMNYYAITALLARVHQYIGNHTEAMNYAKEVLNLEISDYYGVQKAFDKDDFAGIQSVDWGTKADLKITSNLIFALYNQNAVLSLELDKYFNKTSNGIYGTWLIINQDAQRIWYDKNGNDEASYDYRNIYWIFLVDGLYPLSGKYYLSDNEVTRNKNATILPVIRATEMHYIIAESNARNGNFTEAQNILNELRRRRGFGTQPPVSIANWDEFIDELIRDARREWISEGQLFYLYKRLDAPVNFGNNVIRPLTRTEYLVPVPDDQRL